MSVLVKHSLPKGWAKDVIGNFALTTSGGTPKRGRAEYYANDVPWVKSGDLNDSALFSVQEHISQLGLEKSSAKLFKPGTVLVALYGATIGRLSILQIEAATNQAVCGITLPDGVDNKYLFYYLLNIREELIGQGKGGAQPNISQGVVKAIEVPLAPPEQQKRIVAKIEELFSHIDAGVAALNQAKKLLKQYRQSVLKAAVTGELTKQWREENKDKLEPASKLLECILTERRERWEVQQLEQFKAKGKVPKDDKWKSKYKELDEIMLEELHDFPELPYSWVYTRLGNVVDDPKYGTSKRCSYDKDGVGVLRIPNVANGEVDSSDLKYAKFDEKEIKTYELVEGDILTIRSNGSVSLVGKCALIGSKDTDFLFAGYLIRLRPIAVVAVGSYVLDSLKSVYLRNQIESKAKSTSGVNNINSGELQSLIVPICQIDEQRECNRIVDEKIMASDRMLSEIDQKFVMAERNKQSILASAFSGNLMGKI